MGPTEHRHECRCGTQECVRHKTHHGTHCQHGEALDWEIMEYSCEENNKDLYEGHLKQPPH